VNGSGLVPSLALSGGFGDHVGRSGCPSASENRLEGTPHRLGAAETPRDATEMSGAGGRRAVAGPLGVKQVFPNRLAIEARQPVDPCDRKALSTKGAKIIHVSTSQQPGHLLLAGVLVTQIQSGLGILLL
jgi:hypothetical protein